MKFRRRERTLNFPFRFDGILLVWCIKGRLSVSINLNDYILKENTLFLCVPGNIFKLNEIISDEEELHYVCIAMSREFAADQKVDVNKTFSNGLSLMDDPSVALSEEESAMIADYIDMMGKVARSELTYKKESIQSLWTSMIYIFAGVLDNRAKTKDPAESTNRSRLLFEQFISLVAKYHGQYRNVGFYADKLCLTPKYLSKLIKNATGRSAPEWIDAYVILEAKNMLKYSNETIKEIDYKLNFPNQSVFYKFFKARTGMTPSEYRNS
jgi:AraC-like DNA-binding protein